MGSIIDRGFQDYFIVCVAKLRALLELNLDRLTSNTLLLRRQGPRPAR
ncbi:hypothetical protein [Mycetohabitans rhizoxinica]